MGATTTSLTMGDYLRDTRFAAESVIDAYIRDFNLLNKKIVAYNEANHKLAATGTVEVKPSEMEKLRLLTATFQEARRLAVEIHETSTALKNRAAATSSLCGALLQISKQGISAVHGGLTSCPSGRTLRSQTLKTVIWEGRNQAMHWEDTAPLKQKVMACFAGIDADYSWALSAEIKKRSLATAVIDLLEWRNYSDYEADMLSLA